MVANYDAMKLIMTLKIGIAAASILALFCMSARSQDLKVAGKIGPHAPAHDFKHRSQADGFSHPRISSPKHPRTAHSNSRWGNDHWRNSRMKPGNNARIGGDFKSGIGPGDARRWRPRPPFWWNYDATSKYGYGEKEQKAPVRTTREWELSDQKTDEETPAEKKKTFPAPKIVTVDGSAAHSQTANEEKSARHYDEGRHIRIENKLQKKVYSTRVGAIEIYGSAE